ncbi:MAG: hypothetical protein JKY08_08380 [Flavobacteriaceae bacterium]|nr:hypothetical protein [Flavobacteriaceae bacterium]
MKTIIFSLLLLVFSSSIVAQNTNKMILYNIGLGSVFSGVGAVINKKPNQKWTKVFFKGLSQGALGGTLIYGSKKITEEFTKKKHWSYSWGGKLVNAAGASIIENASLNRNFWEQWNLNFGFNRLEFHTNGRFKVKYKIMPISFAITVNTALNNKFEFKKSLQYGQVIFSSQTSKTSYEIGGHILLNRKGLKSHRTLAHEIIHIYQSNDYNFINTYFNKSIKKWRKKSVHFKKLNNFLYFDIHEPITYGLYSLEKINNTYYNDNFFEYEAWYFPNKKYRL